MTKLVGEDALQNTQIVTTMWDRVTEAEGSGRLEQLSKGEDMFKPALDKNAGITCHHNTYETAKGAILSILTKSKPPFVLAIQKELVDEHKELPQTEPGIEVDRYAAELIKKHQEEVSELAEEMKDAAASQDTANRKQLEEEAARLKAQMEQTDGERKRMQTEYTRKRREVGEHYQKYEKLEKEQVALKEQVRGLRVPAMPQPSSLRGRGRSKENTDAKIQDLELKIQDLEYELQELRDWRCVIC
jgi:hypothetical protein